MQDTVAQKHIGIDFQGIGNFNQRHDAQFCRTVFNMTQLGDGEIRLFRQLFL